MKIVLVRHAKPVLPPMKRISPKMFGQWVIEYNNSTLYPTSVPPDETLKVTDQCVAVVCNQLMRSIESAKILGKTDIILTDAIFNEAEIPNSDMKFPKLSPKIWALFFRVVWLFKKRRIVYINEIKGQTSLEYASRIGKRSYVRHIHWPWRFQSINRKRTKI